MKINGLSSTGTNAPTARTGGAKPAPSEPAAGEADEVRLSPVSSALQAGGGEPVVDAARVQEIRQAISEGRFKIDASAIADRLITTARDLIESQRKA